MIYIQLIPLLYNHSFSDYDARVEKYAQNVRTTMYKFFNDRDSHYMKLNESSESVATWITANVKHLQYPDEVT